jgi:hypothetical protein
MNLLGSLAVGCMRPVCGWLSIRIIESEASKLLQKPDEEESRLMIGELCRAGQYLGFVKIYRSLAYLLSQADSGPGVERTEYIGIRDEIFVQPFV